MAEAQTVVPQLPDHVLLKIFSFGPTELSVRLVCKTFKSIFDWNIGVKWGGIPTGPVYELEGFETLDELPCCRTFRLSSDPESKTIPIAIPKFKSKHFLNTLCVGAQVTDSSLNQTLTGLTALETLLIWEKGMISFSCSTYLNDLINLKGLTIFMAKVNDEEYIEKLISFLKFPKFHNLQCLEIILPLQHIRENIFCDALLTFLIKHQNTIRVLIIGLTNVIKMEDDSPDLPDFEIRLNELDYSKLRQFHTLYGERFSKIGEICDRILMQGKMLELVDECVFLKEEFLSKYKNKFGIDINYGLAIVAKPIPHDMIRNNSATLVDIGLVIVPEDCLPLDCSIFASCKSLKQLRLFLTYSNSNAEITKLTTLPSTLEKLSIVNLQMKSEEVHSLAMRKPCLKNVNFGNLGTANGYGLTVASYLCFTAPEANTTGYIINSWNIPDLVESLHHRGPYHRLLALSLMKTKQIELKNTNDRPQYAEVILNPVQLKPIDLYRNM